MTIYLLLSALSLLGMVVILAILALLRLLNEGNLSGILIDGYALLIVAFIALLAYVFLARSGIIESPDTRVIYLTVLSIYLLLSKIIVLLRLGRYIRDTVRLIRAGDGTGNRPTHSGAEGNEREVRILAGNLRVTESTEGTTSDRVLREDSQPGG